MIEWKIATCSFLVNLNIPTNLNKLGKIYEGYPEFTKSDKPFNNSLQYSINLSNLGLDEKKVVIRIFKNRVFQIVGVKDPATISRILKYISKPIYEKYNGLFHYIFPKVNKQLSFSVKWSTPKMTMINFFTEEIVPKEKYQQLYNRCDQLQIVDQVNSDHLRCKILVPPYNKKFRNICIFFKTGKAILSTKNYDSVKEIKDFIESLVSDL